MTKKELRKKYISKREELSISSVHNLSHSIVSNLLDSNLIQENQVIHIFKTIESKKEVNTDILINWIWDNYNSTQLCTSKIDYSTDVLEHFNFNQQTKFELDKWDIPVPIKGSKVPPKDINIILTPLLAFNSNGYRVGYGKGYYDRFFSECSDSAVKIGVSLFDELVQIDDLNKFDVPLDFCITPNNTFRFH